MLSSIRRRPRHQDLAPGRYLTDRHRLLRVLARFEIPGSILVCVEDCKTFERHVYAGLELKMMRCRRVKPPAQPPVLAPEAVGRDVATPAAPPPAASAVQWAAPAPAPADR